MINERSSQFSDLFPIMPFNVTVQPAIRSLLGEQQPRSIMLLGELPEIDWQACLNSASETSFNKLSADCLHQLPDYGVQDLVAVGNVLEVLPRRDGEVLLAGLRDLHARRVLLRLVPTTAWRHQDVMSFGFTQLARLNHQGAFIRYYGFDLYTYKTTPDWLNAKYWANPELFGRYRW